MTRLKLEKQDVTHFTTTLPVQISHINYGNHLGHDSLISMMHEARIQFLRQYNYTETDIDGVGFVVSQLIVDYKNESFYGDELIFNLTIEKVNKRSCYVHYNVENKKNGHIIAYAQIMITFYDFDLRKSTSIPKSFEESVLKN